MKKAYSRIDWQNQPSTSTALGATNLNKMDIALNTIDDRVMTLDTTKLDLTTANSMVKSFSLDQSTGVITITLLDGTVTTYDTKLEKLAVNFAYDATAQQLVITLDDGTKQYVDMSALITQYEFKDSSTVGFSVDASGKVSASVKNGSITAEQLQPNYLADITTQQQTATAQAKLSKRYAVGGVETGDTTDNAKYYKEQAELFKTQAKQYRDEAQDISGVGIAAESKLGLVKGNGNVAVQTDGSMWANPYKDLDVQTGTFVTTNKADDALAQINVKGITTATPTNPDLPISPDNKLILSNPLNFDLVSSKASRNMSEQTNQGSLNWHWIIEVGDFTKTEQTLDGIDCCVLTRGNKERTGYSVITYSKIGRRLYKPNTKYTISFEIKTNLSLNTIFSVDFQGNNGQNSLLKNALTGITAKPNVWNKIVGVVTTKDILPTFTEQVMYIQGLNSDIGTQYIFRNLKIEEGVNENPIWTPAPEEVQYNSATDGVYKINIPYPMRSLPSGYDEIKSGQHTQNVGNLILDGTETLWSLQSINSYGIANFSIPLNSNATGGTSGLCNLFKPQDSTIAVTTDEGFLLANKTTLYIRVKKERASTVEQFKTLLAQWKASGSPLTVQYPLVTPVITDLNTYLKTFKGTTNIYTTATPQVELTATFKSQLWADSYLKDKAIESKFDKDRIVNNFLATDPTTALSGAMGRLLNDKITELQNTTSIMDARGTNKNASAYRTQRKTLEFNLSTDIGLPVADTWQCIVETDLPWIDLTGTPIQKAYGYDTSGVYREFVRNCGYNDDWGAWLLNNDLKQTADLLPEADILAANSSVYPSMASKIGNVVTLSFLFKKRDGSNFAVGQNVLLAKIPSGYTTTTNLCASGLGSMTEDLSSPDTTKPQSIVFWNNGIFAHIAHETKVIGGSITYFI